MNLEDTIFTFSFWSNLAFHVLESGFAGFLESSLSGIDSRFKTCHKYDCLEGCSMRCSSQDTD